MKDHPHPSIFFIICKITFKYCSVFTYNSGYAAKLPLCVDLTKFTVELAIPPWYAINLEPNLYRVWPLGIFINGNIKYLVLDKF